MKHLSSTSWLLLILVLLCGCGGGARTSHSPSVAPPPPPPGPPPTGDDITGNWQFSATSTAFPSIPLATIAGSVTQSGNSVNGEVHVDGSGCFDYHFAVGLAGTLTDGNVSLTSTSVDGQVLTFVGSITKKSGFPDTFTGTYAINGGCAGGQQGDATGYRVDSLTGYWAGNLTTAGGTNIHWDTQLVQGSASSEGSFGLDGAFTFDGICFSSGTITSGTYPSASFIMGTPVVLEIKTDNGTMTFLGTMEPYGLIEGNYAISGGSCASTGTGYLSPWEY